jgi:hypothetical protein
MAATVASYAIPAAAVAAGAGVGLAGVGAFYALRAWSGAIGTAKEIVDDFFGFWQAVIPGGKEGGITPLAQEVEGGPTAENPGNICKTLGLPEWLCWF